MIGYLSPEIRQAWIVKAYGLHVLMATMIVVNGIIFIVSLIFAVFFPIVFIISAISLFHGVAYAYAYVVTYLKRSDEFINAKYNLNPELVQAILDLIEKDKQV